MEGGGGREVTAEAVQPGHAAGSEQDDPDCRSVRPERRGGWSQV